MSLTAKAIERFVVPRLAHRLCNYNGVVVRPRRTWQLDGDRRDYEAALCSAIRREVRTGDTVVVVGGGLGVSSVVAARHAGARGRVETYEATSHYRDRVDDTAALNNVADRVTAHHAVVEAWQAGEYGREAYGDPDGEQVSLGDLPDADVLVMDAEGAEAQIVPALAGRHTADRPRSVIVETHGFLGASTDDVQRELRRLGYRVEWCGTEDAERDVHVLCAGNGGTA